MSTLARLLKPSNLLLKRPNQLSAFGHSNKIQCLSTLAPENEPLLKYEVHSDQPHCLELQNCLKELEEQMVDVPIIIGDKEYRTGEVRHQSCPFNHKQKVAQFYYADQELIHKATQVALESKRDWQNVPPERKLGMFERAADLVSGKFRQKLNASTMMGQAKTIKQAEIDASAELADFLRFNVHYMRQLLEFGQPISTEFEKNSLNLLPLDGFVASISPFNFTAIGGNLATAPVLMGNCVVWKPSDSAMLSNYVILQLLKEAGFPPGVVNFVPSEGLDFGRVVTGSHRLAGINFTGSLATFQWLWSEVGLNIKRYSTFPRLVGECGGKNFHLIHKSANLDTALAQTVRSAFEFSGQKCSACSRLYVPADIWQESFRDKLVAIARDEVKVGEATSFTSYTSAVIDRNAYQRIKNYINYAKACQKDIKIVCGGEASDEIGYFIQPTILETKNPKHRLMEEEIFGPVLTVYPYQENELDYLFDLIDSNPYALTGAVFAQDENFMKEAQKRLSVGNLYLNDKSTGAVVGQQPFGGWRHSGTNDKAGGPHYLMRWANQQTIKRTTKNLVEY